MINIFRLIRALFFCLFSFFLLGQITLLYGETLEKTFQFNYNRSGFDIVSGFRVYMGLSEDKIDQKIGDFSKDSAAIVGETPVLLNEKFDSDTSAKYQIEGGKWTWQSSTKNMLVETGADQSFKLVLPYEAGSNSAFSFYFGPKKSHTDQATVMCYLKDLTNVEYKTAYYELRMADKDSTRYSNWRKVVNSKFGGVEGAFSLPRYAQCSLKSEGETICPGFFVSMDFEPGAYAAQVNGVDAIGNDQTPIDISRFEIILTNQDGWIDNIMIGGKMVLQKKINVDFPDSRVWFAVTAYNSYGESAKSLPVRYDLTSGTQNTGGKIPAMPSGIIILN